MCYIRYALDSSVTAKKYLQPYMIKSLTNWRLEQEEEINIVAQETLLKHFAGVETPQVRP